MPDTAIPNAHITDALRTLADARRQVATLKTVYVEKKRAFEAENAELIASVAEAELAEIHVDRVARELAEAHFKATGDTKPVPGVSVSISRKPKYDKEVAFAWAKSSHVALSPEALDVKAFEKVAPLLDLDFVTMEETPKVMIATDLDKVLGGAS